MDVAIGMVIGGGQRWWVAGKGNWVRLRYDGVVQWRGAVEGWSVWLSGACA